MAYIDIDVDSNIGTVYLGMQRENIAEGIRFDMTKWYEDHGEGGVTYAYIRRPSESAAYLKVLDISDNYAIWTFDSVDTGLSGTGKAQILYEIDDIIKKSTWFNTVVDPSEGDAGDTPDPYEPFIDQVRAILTETVIAAQEAAEHEAAAAASQEAAETAAEEAAASAQEAENVFQIAGDVSFSMDSDTKKVTMHITES